MMHVMDPYYMMHVMDPYYMMHVMDPYYMMHVMDPMQTDREEDEEENWNPGAPWLGVKHKIIRSWASVPTLGFFKIAVKL